MKMINIVPKLLILLLYLLVHKILFPFSLSLSFHQQQTLLVHKLTSLIKSYNKLVVFFAFNILLMTIYLEYSKPSIQEFNFISLIDPSESSALHDEDKTKLKDSGDENSNDIILRLQYIELIDDIGEDRSNGGVISDVDSDDFHGYDGYDEENDIDYGSDDDDDYGEYEKDDDLKSRIEEFIAENNRKWKEEHFSDKFDLQLSDHIFKDI